MRRLPLVAAVALSLFAAPAAHADTFAVGGLGDPADPPPCTPLTTGAWQCPSLRSAVIQANGTAAADSIVLGAPGDVTLNSPLTLANEVTFSGAGQNTSGISGNGSVRTLTANAGAKVTLIGVTLRRGSTPSDNGANLLVNAGAQVNLTLVRVTGGVAARGAGIANRGTLTIANSLVDGNTAQFVGGAVFNEGQLSISDSTLAGNIAPAGAAIRSEAGASIALSHATIGRNGTGSAGVSFGAPQTATANGTIFAHNGNANCEGGTFAATGSIELGASCGLTGPSNRNADPGLSAELVPTGGDAPTSVLTIPASSPAVDLESPCQSVVDQRFAARVGAAGAPCDAGAYEVAASGTAQPLPTPTPTPIPEPTPVANRSVAGETVKGKVLVKEPGSSRFVELSTDTIPNGSEVDTRKGTVELRDAQGGVAQFHDGLFKVSQRGGLTTLTLSEKLTGCKTRRLAATKKKSRKLWGDGKGRFRTKGQYGAATIRGTEWLTEDRCKTTFFRVRQGVITVRDNVKRKNVILRKGKRYTVRAR